MYYDDVQPGMRTEFGSYTFTVENIKAFATQFDPQPFHLDDEAARQSIFGGLAASGWHVACAFMRAMVLYMQREDEAATARGEPVTRGGPSPGFKNLKWLRPTYAGDTITYALEILDKRLSSSRPQWGLVFQRITGINQRGELVISFEPAVFLPRREPDGC